MWRRRRPAEWARSVRCIPRPLPVCPEAPGRPGQSLKHLSETELPICVTKGHLYSQSKGVTRIFGDYSLNTSGGIDEVGNSTIIPNSVIKDIKKI